MNWQSLNTIWKPDTFFVNGKKSKMHKITVPNKFLRITPDGHVSYSQRLTIHARCRMHLLKFPLDSQICPLWISSYGYASRYVGIFTSCGLVVMYFERETIINDFRYLLTLSFLLETAQRILIIVIGFAFHH